ncbi:MAG TPA: hypothetical protein VL093_14995 [Flavipsychrobacter sp.]|nr:hypothetical protein [Flavipsychrobacter sp.]
MNFNEYNWHDSIIKNIQIDRSNPGKTDTILFEIQWRENDKKSVLVFEEVYWASFNLNFGIVCNETILNAALLDSNDEDLRQFYLKWKGRMDDITLNPYMIELNSTGGRIKIIAKSFSEKST